VDVGVGTVLAVTIHGVLFVRQEPTVYWNPHYDSERSVTTFTTMYAPARMRVNWHESEYYAFSIEGLLRIGSACFPRQFPQYVLHPANACIFFKKFPQISKRRRLR
jgi:hypothetical protein